MLCPICMANTGKEEEMEEVNVDYSGTAKDMECEFRCPTCETVFEGTLYLTRLVQIFKRPDKK